MAEKTLLEKLEGLQHKFEEISTLITDPAVIGDMKRYVKLNKEYRELERIMQAQQEYKTALTHLAEAKEILDGENDPEMREMAQEELQEAKSREEQLEQQLYSWGQEVDSNAIEVHIHNLRRKLGNTLIHTVRGVGYTLMRDAPAP